MEPNHRVEERTRYPVSISILIVVGSLYFSLDTAFSDICSNSAEVRECQLLGMERRN